MYPYRHQSKNDRTALQQTLSIKIDMTTALDTMGSIPSSIASKIAARQAENHSGPVHDKPVQYNKQDNAQNTCKSGALAVHISKYVKRTIQRMCGVCCPQDYVHRVKRVLVDLGEAKVIPQVLVLSRGVVCIPCLDSLLAVTC